jgi:hypothetical protein
MKSKTVIQRVKGSLLDLRGSLKPKSVPEDLKKVREQAKKKVARRVR